jgi:hypothetical protein
MSAYPLRADMRSVGINVRYVPTADLGVRMIDARFAPEIRHARNQAESPNIGT